ncbi:MAG TPA: hypothetical protein VK947_08295 [Planococcus sp. (in: firmicutes)]|nr:hypothetical protein [Planococcus sp. (in: firmicutes)]
MSLLKEEKEKEAIRKKRNQIRIITWLVVAVALVLVWYFTN